MGEYVFYSRRGLRRWRRERGRVSPCSADRSLGRTGVSYPTAGARDRARRRVRVDLAWFPPRVYDLVDGDSDLPDEAVRAALARVWLTALPRAMLTAGSLTTSSSFAIRDRSEASTVDGEWIVLMNGGWLE